MPTRYVKASRRAEPDEQLEFQAAAAPNITTRLRTSLLAFGGTVAYMAALPPFSRVYKQRAYLRQPHAARSADALARPPTCPIPPLTGAPRDSSASTAASSRAASRTTSTAHPPQSTETASGIARIGARASNKASDAAFSAHRCAAVWSSAITRQNTAVAAAGTPRAERAPSDACSASSTAFGGVAVLDRRPRGELRPDLEAAAAGVLRRRAVASMRWAIHRRHDFGRAVAPAAGALCVLRAALLEVDAVAPVLAVIKLHGAAMACPQRCPFAPSFVHYPVSRPE